MSHVRNSHVGGSHYLEEVILYLNYHVFGVDVFSWSVLFKFLDLIGQCAVEELIEEYEKELFAYVKLKWEN